MAELQYPIRNNFSRGELSSRMNGRVDIPGYYQGCKDMTNCIIVSQGGAEKRPGTIHLGETSQTAGFETTARLITFEVADDESYILEVGHRGTRVWDTQTKEVITDLGDGDTYLKTPYSGIIENDEVSELQYAVTEGKIFLAHNKHPFSIISRTWGYEGSVLVRRFILEEFTTVVHPWDSSIVYGYDDVVEYLNQYWRADTTTTEAVAPFVESWEKRLPMLNESPTGHLPTVDIGTYSTGNFAAGVFKISGPNVYESVKPFTGDADIGYACVPGVEISYKVPNQYVTRRPHQIWIIREKTFRNKASDYQAEMDALFGGPGITVIITSVISFVTSGYGEYNGYITLYYNLIKYTHAPTVGTDEEFWKKVCSLPGGTRTRNLYRWVDGSTTPVAGRYYYDSTTYQSFLCVKDSPVVNPTDEKQWSLLEGNPFFSLPGDFPASVAFMSQRLYLGGTLTRPQTIFASKVGLYSDFNIGVGDADPFSFEIAAERSSRIKWMMAKDNLMIGTTSSEWLVTGGGVANITATNVQVLRQSSYGSAYNQANYVADSLLFYQKGGRKLREYMYSNDNKAYLANDLTFYADHITGSGVSESSYQQNPDSIYWSVTNEGILIGLTYDRLNQIAGWHKHTTSGIIESVCVVDGPGEEEEIWIVARRKTTAGYSRNVEVFSSRLQENQSTFVYSDSSKTFVAGGVFRSSQITNAVSSVSVSYIGFDTIADGLSIKLSNTGSPVFDNQVFTIANLVEVDGNGTFDLAVDGALFITDPFDDLTSGVISVVTDTITGLDHLEGMEVSILGDGAVFPKATVASVPGGIGVVLPSKCNTVVCGLSYDMMITPESFELGGSTASKKKRISRVLLKLYKAMGGYILSNSSNTIEELKYRTTEIPLGLPPTPFTGTKEVPVDFVTGVDAEITIVNNQPVPMTILAIVTEISYAG